MVDFAKPVCEGLCTTGLIPERGAEDPRISLGCIPADVTAGRGNSLIPNPSANFAGLQGEESWTNRFKPCSGTWRRVVCGVVRVPLQCRWKNEGGGTWHAQWFSLLLLRRCLLRFTCMPVTTRHGHRT